MNVRPRNVKSAPHAIAQVRRAVGEVAEVFVPTEFVEDVGRAAVAVLADQGVDVRMLAKPADAGGDDEQFAAIGECHPRAVNRLVRDPRAAELVRLHHADDLLHGLVEHRDVLFPRLPGGREVRLAVVADMHPGCDEPTLRVAGQHDLDIQVRQVSAEVGFRLSKQARTGVVRVPRLFSIPHAADARCESQMRSFPPSPMK